MVMLGASGAVMTPLGEEKAPTFGAFIDCWQALPRDRHPLVPCISACTPATLGPLMAYVALAVYNGKYDMRTTFVGSEIERLAGTVTDGMNYYDSMSDDLKAATHMFHKYLLETPCGAYVGDVVTAKSGLIYRFETMQFPLCDQQGQVRHIIAFGQGRSPIRDRLTRTEQDHRVSNLQDMHYLDIGAGAPAARIIDFEFSTGKPAG